MPVKWPKEVAHMGFKGADEEPSPISAGSQQHMAPCLQAAPPAQLGSPPRIQRLRPGFGGSQTT